MSRAIVRTSAGDGRPREKLARWGPRVLSDAELLTLVIQSGNGGVSAVELGRRMLSGGRSLKDLSRLNLREWMRLHGVGASRAAALSAVFELGRRVQAAQPDTTRLVRGPDDVAHILGPDLRYLPHEEFHVLVLDARNAVKHTERLSVGTLNASLAHPREVFKRAIDWLAAGVVVVHNHPSGNPEPSEEDISLTRQLVEAGRIIGIPLHDHIIIAGSGYTSLAERGFIRS